MGTIGNYAGQSCHQIRCLYGNPVSNNFSKILIWRLVCLDYPWSPNKHEVYYPLECNKRTSCDSALFILTLNIQIHHNRCTVSNIIGCLTHVFPVLTSWRVYNLKKTVVPNIWSVRKTPLYGWGRMTAGIAQKLCVGRFVYCKTSRWIDDFWWIW